MVMDRRGKKYHLSHSIKPENDFNGGFMDGHPFKNKFSVEYNTKLDSDNMLSMSKEDASIIYGDDEFDSIRSRIRLKSMGKDIRLEALSDSDAPDTTVFSGGSGFLTACLTAFAQHLPLALSPGHVWILLSYAFAKHVDKHAEVQWKNFVQH